ncbi:hypothetical protein A8B82_16200 [Sulfitobacter sp. EhC04]|uniref:TRAP transporter substrate-binding protein DctP n=1 Tax=Sulfitobacter sp. EhC04 TaxID=1849168 RepID=UPI0007F4D8D4|nr:TRAP transporter substrate-binding protein DctP [Sulfitobacter sp. EhC04]OAN75938.1 hypothetical protein A8B82_16200 [Sulfitobacter sp. EhC04]
MKLNNLLGVAAAVGISVIAGTAQSESFRAATWNGANSPNDVFLSDFADYTREATNGGIDFEVFPGGALLPARGTLEGLEQGVAQFANITAAYIPAKMPVDFITADMSFIAEDQMALAFAKTEVTFFNQQMQNELSELDVVFGAGFTIGVYNLICGFEVNTIADLAGRTIRTSSDAQVGYADLIGAVSVNAPGNEIYTGIQRGTIDCTTGTALYLTDFFQMHEIAKSVFMIPLGSNANGGYYFSQSFWEDRTPEERSALLHAASRATVKSMVEWGAKTESAWRVAREAQIPLVQPTSDDLAALEAFSNQFVADLPANAMENRGIEDPSELVQAMITAYEKWETLLADVDRTDIDAITALVDREIFDKIDVNTYGIE